MKFGTEISSALRKNSLITILSLIFSFLIGIGGLSFGFYAYTQKDKFVYGINTKGEIIPLKLLSKKKQIQEFVKGHVDLFVDRFYNLNEINWKEKTEQSLWLGDNSIEALYKDKLAKQYYNRFVQYGIRHNAKIKDGKINITSLDEPYGFSTTIELEVINQDISQFYEIDITGSLIEVDVKYPQNPFGFLITEFTEQNTRRINKE